ncbi:hypothetical protein C0995_000930 [Termitomyces sp. Mi166|nr:hypothetical protein C0995_000930 [Termitomyces sp. Mi166\
MSQFRHVVDMQTCNGRDIDHNETQTNSFVCIKAPAVKAANIIKLLSPLLPWYVYEKTSSKSWCALLPSPPLCKSLCLRWATLPFTNPPQNLGYISPSVFTPYSAPPQPLSDSQPTPILHSSEPFSQDLSSCPPPVFVPYSAYPPIDNPQPLPILSSGDLGFISSAYPPQQPFFQNLSSVPPSVFTPHPQFSNMSHPPVILSSENVGFQSPASEDDDVMEMEWELPLGEPMSVDSVETVMWDIGDNSSHIVEPTMLRNHLGICTSLPYPLVAQQRSAFSGCNPQPLLYPESCHSLLYQPNTHNELDTPTPSPEWSAIDTAHVNSLYSSTPSYPLYKRQEALGWSTDDVTLVRPADSPDHLPSLYEAEEQEALKWFASKTARVRSVNSRSSHFEAFESSVASAALIHPTQSSMTFHPPFHLRQEATATDDVTRWGQHRKSFAPKTQPHLTQVLVGNATSKVKITGRQPRPIRCLPGSIRPRSNPLPPEIPDSSSWSFGGWKRKREVEKAQPVYNDDRQAKRLRVAVQAVPTALLNVSTSVLKVSVAVLIGFTSAAVKTSFVATKHLISAVGNIVGVKSTPPAKPPPEVIVIDDDDEEEIETPRNKYQLNMLLRLQKLRSFLTIFQDLSSMRLRFDQLGLVQIPLVLKVSGCWT